MNASDRHYRSVGLVLLSSTSLQLGLAVAATTFAEAGPISAVWIRSVVGAALLWLYIRPNLASYTRDRLGPIVLYGVALAAMTLCAYVAISHAPLGIVSAVLMLGPLTIAALGSRTTFDLGVVAVAAGGALLLTLSRGGGGSLEVGGLLFAALAALAYAAYILVGKRVNSTGDLSGLALALVVTALLQTPLGIAYARPGLTDPGVLLTLALAGVLATLIPFSAEAVALRTLSAATFGLVLAFEPAIAAVMGVLVRGDSLTLQQWAGILLIIAAAAGSLGPRKWMRSMGEKNAEKLKHARVAALADVPLLDALTTDELVALVGATEEREVEVGDRLTVQGESGEDFYVILSGHVQIDDHGRVIRELGAGDYLGEIALLFGGPRTATATATEQTKVLVLSRDHFVALLATHPEIENKVMMTVSERIRYR